MFSSVATEFGPSTNLLLVLLVILGRFLHYRVKSLCNQLLHDFQ